MTTDRIIQNAAGTALTYLEWLFALVVLAGIVAYAVGSIPILLGLDWRLNDSFYELIYRVLLLVIGIELIRMLLTHELSAILELLAFVIARETLKPETTSSDIALCVLAFVALLAAKRYLFRASVELRSRDPQPRTKRDHEPAAK